MITGMLLSCTSDPDGTRRRRSAASRLRLCLDLWSERRHLEAMDDRALADIGLNRVDVVREAARRPWDIPTHRDV